MNEIGNEADNKVNEKTGICNAEEGEEQARNAERSAKGEVIAFTKNDPTSDISKTSPFRLICPL